MKTTARTFIRRIAIVSSVLGISMLGNLRSQASEKPSIASPAAAVVPSKSRYDESIRRAASVSLLAFDNDVDGGADDEMVSEDVATDDEGRLVPAIYAWDPDVRFVYFRHVSKWM